MTMRTASTVLLVDDDSTLRELAQLALAESGLRVIQAHSADQAWSILASAQTVDLVLSDVSMPGSMNGVELAARIPSLRENLPVVLMSGDWQAGLNAPSEVTFLPKPFDLGQMVRAVERSLAGRPARAA